jgi:hypothetical protein
MQQPVPPLACVSVDGSWRGLGGPDFATKGELLGWTKLGVLARAAHKTARVPGASQVETQPC